MQQTINITLPTETIGLLDRVTETGNRSSFIDEAIRFYAVSVERKKLKQRLKEGALRNAERDLQMAEEWFPLEEEAWQKHQE
jgi:CopG family transcriptional regulator/antitoxin EndoAI